MVDSLERDSMAPHNAESVDGAEEALYEYLEQYIEEA